MEDRRQEDINAILQWREDLQHSHQLAHASHGRDGESGENEAEPENIETIHVYFVPESELEAPEDKQVVESTLAAGSDGTHYLAISEDELAGATPLHIAGMEEQASLLKPSTRTTRTRWIALVVVALLLLLFASQVILTFLTPSPIITLVPIVRTFSTTTTLMAATGVTAGTHIPARPLAPLTLIQTTTEAATGKGHQDARAALGTITFYNGLFTSQTIAAGTTLTASDGVRVIIDQPAVIPAAISTTPPTYGHVTVSAHALVPGPQGNIPARDINQACCLPSALAQNTAAFQGGQEERDYTVVTREDIDRGVASLTPMIIQSAHAAFTAQLMTREALVSPSCTRTVAADHQPGAEASKIAITVSEQCTALAYDSAVLLVKAEQQFTRELEMRTGAHYRLVGALQVNVLHAQITGQRREFAALTVRIQGALRYQFNRQELQRIRQLVAGKTVPQALHILSGLPGIQQAAISGLVANRSLPMDGSHFQVHVLPG